MPAPNGKPYLWSKVVDASGLGRQWLRRTSLHMGHAKLGDLAVPAGVDQNIGCPQVAMYYGGVAGVQMQHALHNPTILHFKTPLLCTRPTRIMTDLPVCGCNTPCAYKWYCLAFAVGRLQCLLTVHMQNNGSVHAKIIPHTCKCFSHLKPLQSAGCHV